MTAVERLAASLGAHPQDPELRRSRAKAILAADPALAGAIELGLAWQAAEAALPEGWVVWRLAMLRDVRHRDPLWQAVAGEIGVGRASGEGLTAAAALRALTERLKG